MYGQTAPQASLKHVPAPRSALLAVQRYRASRSKQVVRSHMRPPLTGHSKPHASADGSVHSALRAPWNRTCAAAAPKRKKIIIKDYFLRLHFNVDFIFGKSKFLENFQKIPAENFSKKFGMRAGIPKSVLCIFQKNLLLLDRR